MPIVNIPLAEVVDLDTFHTLFARVLGFPDFYGRNWAAWVDCLTYEDDGMTAYPVAVGEVLTLQLDDFVDFRDRCPDIAAALLDEAAFVNWRRLEMGERAILAISYDAQGSAETPGQWPKRWREELLASSLQGYELSVAPEDCEHWELRGSRLPADSPDQRPAADT